eukprot:TRINITY_DN603_c1_g1_i8.p1 TRINITY_DN603_c1_g1~~TRINITY_DN603_c1_g1_i8.p1  ORF type:complete len:237 (+),score=-0.33 TRINITY_DN603_c1_g1_i8:155-865(+)
MSDKWQVQLQRRAQDQVGTQTPVRAHPDRADQSEEESQENCATYLKVSKIPCRIGRGYRMLQSRKVQALASFSQQRCVVDSKPRQFEHGINLEYNRMYNFLRQYFQSYRNGKYLQFGVFLDENSKHDIIANFGQSLTKEWLVLANHVALPKKALKPQDDVRIIAIEDCLKQQHFQRISNSKSVYLNYFVQHSPFLVNAFFLSFLICCQRNKLFWSSSQSLTLLIQTVGANEDYVGF